VQSDGGYKTASDVQGRRDSVTNREIQREARGLRESFRPRHLGILLIRAYQVARAGRPSPCRFIPSCSQYAAEALEVHGLTRGTWLSIKRILRCRPGGGFGVDLVPEVFANNLGRKKIGLAGKGSVSVTSKAG